jgi:amino acid permease
MVRIGSRGAELRNPHFMSILVFFFFIYLFIYLFFFSPFIDRATARTAEPILMVDGSNDVFSRKEVPFGGHVIT